MTKKALVTGATGFVGSNLVKGLLNDGWRVDLIVRPSSSLEMLSGLEHKVGVHRFDGGTANLLEMVADSRPDVVFHVASLVLSEHKPEQIEELIASNLIFGNMLLEAMTVHGVNKFVNTGTYWEHYQQEEYSPVNLYAATKRAFQDILQYYVEARGIRAITLKLFDPYGPNDPRLKLLNLLIEVAKTGQKLAMSSGDQEIDLIHIDDVVGAYLVAAQRLLEDKVKSHEIYGVGSGKPIGLKALVVLLENLFEKKINIEWGGRPYRIRDVMKPWDGGDVLPGWHPQVSLEEGLASLLSQHHVV